jgi:hypothetical protein
MSDLDQWLARREAECWPEDEPAEWECSSCGHLNEHEGRVCEQCEEAEGG